MSLQSLPVSSLWNGTHRIIMLALPPHTTHRLQPLDVGFFKPLQTYYDRFIDRWLRQHPGRTFTEYQFAEAFHKAFRKAGTVATAQHAFAVCGIWPLNPDIFSDADYAASTMTDQSILLENSRRSAGRPKPKLTILYLTFF